MYIVAGGLGLKQSSLAHLVRHGLGPVVGGRWVGSARLWSCLVRRSAGPVMDMVDRQWVDR